MLILWYCESKLTRSAWIYKDHISRRASTDGQTEVLKWLKSKGGSFGKCEINQAAKNGHLETLQYLCGMCEDEGIYYEPKELFSISIKYKKIIEWLYKTQPHYNVPIDEDLFVYAAKAGALETLQWLKAEGCRWDVDACMHTYLNNQKDSLQWLIENGCPCQKYVLAGSGLELRE